MANRPAPTAEDVERHAKRLRSETFQKRDLKLLYEERLRLREEEPFVPDAYDKTATRWKTPLINRNGMEMVRMLNVKSQPHVTPPPLGFRQMLSAEADDPQAVATKIEQFCAVGQQELECYCDHAKVKALDSQVFKAISWIKTMPKRSYWNDYPKKKRNASPTDLLQYDDDSETYKQSATFSEIMEYLHVPSETVYFLGPVGNPTMVLEVKLIDELRLMLDYNLTKQDGNYVDVTTLPAGSNEYRPSNATAKVHVIEYWDREWSLIIVASRGFDIPTNNQRINSKNNPKPYTLDAWNHKFGRVPYFAAPAIETAAVREEERFQSPLWALYAEAPYNNSERTKRSNVSYLTGFPSHVIETAETGDLALDEKGETKTQVEFKPGMIHQLERGQKLAAMPFATSAEAEREMAASDARMEQYSLNPVGQGQSPGADTANSAIAQLRRLLKDQLDMLAQGAADQDREIFRFWLKMIKDYFKERVYARAPLSGDLVSLDPEDIVTLNVDVAREPDAGSDQIIIEKHAMEMKQLGLIDELEFHEQRGKENPEAFVKRTAADRLRLAIEPYFRDQLLANVGILGAMHKLIAANQQGGDANNAIPGLMEGLGRMQAGRSENPTGMGTGAPGMDRTQGVYSPIAQETTQPGAGGEAMGT